MFIGKASSSLTSMDPACAAGDSRITNYSSSRISALEVNAPCMGVKAGRAGWQLLVSDHARILFLNALQWVNTLLIDDIKHV